MLVPHTVGKSYRVPVQQLSDGMSNLSDGMSNSVQLGSQRGDGGGCVPSESLNLTMYITDELEPYRLDSAVDVSRRLDTDVYVSPPRKRVRVADCLPGRSLVDVCPVDPPYVVSKYQYTVSKNVISKKYVLLCMFVPRPCRWMSKTVLIHIFAVCIIMINTKKGLHVFFRVVRDCHLYVLAHATAFMYVDVLKDMFLVSL